MRRNLLAKDGEKRPSLQGELLEYPNSPPYSRLKDQCGKSPGNSEDVCGGMRRQGHAMSCQGSVAKGKPLRASL